MATFSEQDPTGRKPGDEGCKMDFGKAPMFSGLLMYFPDSLKEVSFVSAAGMAKGYKAGSWKTAPQGIQRYLDAAVRHINAHCQGQLYDNQAGGIQRLHLSAACWNLLASTQLLLDTNVEPAADTMEIVLSRGKRTKIDAADWSRLSELRWWASPYGTDQFYACAYKQHKGKQILVSMAREIMGLQPGDARVVDHLNRDPLDNRRCNLRVCTAAQNQRNRRDSGPYGPGISIRDGGRTLSYVVSVSVHKKRRKKAFRDLDSALRQRDLWVAEDERGAALGAERKGAP